MPQHRLALFVLLNISLACVLNAQTGAALLIPKPVFCQEQKGAFEIHGSLGVFAEKEWQASAQLLAQEMKLSVSKSKGKAGILLLKSPELPAAGYALNITQNGITILASDEAGSIHGLFTLLQLRALQTNPNQIPCASIKDYPRFSYRGMHLNVSRNFFPLSFIKKYIDLMALYKFNTFHWHLTDSPGWRLQIDKYPLLSAQAAFRTHGSWTDWSKNGSRFSQEGNAEAYGGYYSKADAKEIVRYAAQRGITVIPEIEIPGHSYEVLAVYPEFSCTGNPYQHHEFCIGNPKTLSFLTDILSEVLAIFPSEYIHIGGDEAGTSSWKNCPKCQALKKEKNLADEHELQAYLIKQLEAFLKSKGRKLIGWDEIINGGLPADATVMSWRGEAGAITAAQQGHDVVMTPGETYLDAYQSNPSTQPLAIGGFLPIQRVYAYEPIPAVLKEGEKKHILGTQGNLWTEFMPSTDQVEYMAFPRAMAIAENGWTPKEAKNFPNFQQRLQAHYLLLQRMNVNYYRPSAFLEVKEAPAPDNSGNAITLISEIYQPEIRYTTDGSTPSSSSERYEKPFVIQGKANIQAAVFKNGIPLGKITSYQANHHRAIGKKTIFNTQWSDSYPAQKENTLTNGIRGSFTYSDKQWLGYLKNFDVTVDMGSVQPIHEVTIAFMQQIGPGVFLPAYVEILGSEDGSNFVPLKKLEHDVSPENPELLFKSFACALEKTKARYIRIVAPNVRGGFMFTDEIVIY